MKKLLFAAVASLSLWFGGCVSAPKPIEGFAGLPPVEARAAEGRFEKIPSDMSKAGSAESVNDTYRIEFTDCAIEIVVSTPKRGGNRSLMLVDGCPREFGPYREANYDYLLKSIASDFPLETITSLYSYSFYNLGLWQESLATASLKSPAWAAYKRDLKAKGYVYPNDYFVELFREAELGAEILGPLRRNGWEGMLASVEKVMTSKPSEVAFLKKNPAFAKVKERVPLTAGIYSFRLAPAKRR